MRIRETKLDRELHRLKDQLLDMARTAEVMIDQAIKELCGRDALAVSEIPQEEQKLNRLQIEIDGQVLALLATCQPVADDLRFLVAASKINSELERIGDLVVNITESAQLLREQPPLKPPVDIPRMADLVSNMVRKSVKAFTDGDVQLAQMVRISDDEVDDLREQFARELLTHMVEEPHLIEQGLSLILVTYYLERIGDHATNIAEEVIYIVDGRDVRHPTSSFPNH